MGRKKKKASSFNAALNIQRRLAVQQGYYDGRFKERRIKDKKKEENRLRSRHKVNLKETD